MAKYSFIINVFGLLSTWKTEAQEKILPVTKTNSHLVFSLKDINFRQTVSTSATDLLAQQNKITRVKGIELNKTNQGLEVILKTVAGSQRLVPLILPENNNLVIDLLDATCYLW